MGRSVSTPSAATLVTYSAQDEDFDGQDVIDDYTDHLRYLFPSITACSKWIGREDHMVGENGHATFGISEYCGLVAYWAVPKTNIGANWLRRIEPKFVKAFGQYVKLGSMSNGEGVYEVIS